MSTEVETTVAAVQRTLDAALAGYVLDQPIAPMWADDPWVGEELAKLWDGKLEFSAMVLADRFDEWEEPKVAAALRLVGDKDLLRETFRDAIRTQMTGGSFVARESALDRAKRTVAHEILRRGFQWWLQKRYTIDVVSISMPFATLPQNLYILRGPRYRVMF